MSTIGIDMRNIGKKRTGDEAVFFNLVKNLAEIDNSNEYELLTDIVDENVLCGIKNSLNIENKPNFNLTSLETANRFVWNFWTLPKYARKKHLDIYLTQYITPFFIPRTTKIITIIHDISFNFYPQFIKWRDLFFLKLLIPLSLRRADKIVGVSKFTHDEIIKYYKIDPQKVDWIHNAVSEDFMVQDVSEEKIKAVKEKYNLPEKFILYLGTLQPRKNIVALLEAYNLARPEMEEMKLVIAGGKGHNFDKNIEKFIKKYKLEKNIIMPGFIDEEDKAAVMKAAQLFVFPSFYEGFGIPILEAMSAGVPVIASDIPPHREIAGKAVLFFNPNIPGELSQKISEIMNSSVLRENLAAEGLKQAEKFSWKRTAEKMAEIFKRLK
ncbi:MAG TPA: glycosyltransferase family 1 protein [Candidatus Moranbacteria bacterium]|nr:glycosyltransferase family 1 protein [Candidatus Moranbacteria bacterium]